MRQLTVGNIERVKKYKFLKKGAMYFILALGIIMLADAFGVKVPSHVSPAITFLVLSYFFWRSKRELAQPQI